MAHVLSIGIPSATYSLSTTQSMLLNYNITPASLEAVAADPETTTVVDNIELMLYAGTTAALMDVYEQIERYLSYARHRQTTGTGDRIFLFFQPDGEDSYRSEILTGFVRPAGDALVAFVGMKMPVTLVVERRGYWEEASVSTAKAATGITNIGNANYVDIASNVIKGSLPTPAIVNIENTNVSSQGYKDIWIWNNAFHDPANFTGYLNGDDLDDGNSPNENTYSITADVDAEEYWDLSDAFLTDTAGGNFRVLVACSDAPTVPGHWHMKVKYLSSVMFTGGEIYDMADGVNDLGVVPVPPGGYEVGNADYDLFLCARNSTTDTATIEFAQLAPASNTRYMFQIGYSVPVGGSIVDKGDEGTAYILNGTDKVPILAPRGKPVMLWPGKANRLHVLLDTGAEDSTLTHDVTVTYRGRKVTL